MFIFFKYDIHVFLFQELLNQNDAECDFDEKLKNITNSMHKLLYSDIPIIEEEFAKVKLIDKTTFNFVKNWYIFQRFNEVNSYLSQLENLILHKENCSLSNSTCEISVHQTAQFQNVISVVKTIEVFEYKVSTTFNPQYASEDHKLCIMQSLITKYMQECLEKIIFDRSKLVVKCRFELWDAVFDKLIINK